MSQANKQTRGNPVSRFFGGLWRLITWLRQGLLNLIFILIVVALIIAVVRNQPPVLPDSFVLRLTPTGNLVDQRQPLDPMTILLDDQAQYAETLARDLVEAIDRAREDERVTDLVLELQYLEGGGFGLLEEVARALTEFRAAGKKVTAVSSNYNQAQYYLASFSDRIYLNDMGTILLTGFGSYRSYFKEALDKLSIHLHVFRVGEYKDAVEPFLRNDMSDASREQNSRWLNDLWTYYTQQIEIQRQLTPGKLDTLISQADNSLAETEGDMAQFAIAQGLVDASHSRQQIRALLIDDYGYDEQVDSYRAIDWYDYLRHQRMVSRALNSADKVGLIVASGAIVEGYHPDGTVGSDTMIQLLREARKREDLKALVIRIDSPGGSAFASEVIRTEIATTRDAGIPVVISMGNVAASGGYWIAAGGDEIWALPTTVTGSIGVFGLVPSFAEGLGKLGIHNDGVGTTPLADAFHLDRTLNPLLANTLQHNVEAIYQRFLNIVAQSRGMSTEAVHAIAEGRVWSGQQAQELGLVDKLGTLEDALSAAAGYAKLEDWEILSITRPLGPSEQLLQQFFGSAWIQGLLGGKTTDNLRQAQHWVNTLTQPLDTLLQHPASNHVYAHCMTCDMQ